MNARREKSNQEGGGWGGKKWEGCFHAAIERKRVKRNMDWVLNVVRLGCMYATDRTKTGAGLVVYECLPREGLTVVLKVALL